MGFKETVTGFAEKVGGTIDKGLEAGKDSYQKMSEKSRINKQINQLNSEINEIFLNIGKTLYQDCPDSEQFGSEFLSVREKYSKISSLKNQLRVIDGMIICPSCKSAVPADSKVCNQCGTPMSTTIPTSEESQGSESSKICPSCGESMPEDARFCGKCGASF